MDYAVILAGGKGERLWPLSRREQPKQLVRVFSRLTMLEETLKRLEGLIPIEQTVIVCNGFLAEKIKRSIPALDHRNFVVEPQGRNSAPALYLAAACLEKRDPDSSMVVLTSDHYITPPDLFQQTINQALRLARDKQALVTLGIPPRYPETGYGYIITHPDGRVERFAEKPDHDTAVAYIRQGNTYWNSGMFIWETRRLIQALETYQPADYRIWKDLMELPEADLMAGHTQSVFSRFTATSIDYAVMEKADNVWCIPAAFEWNDVGSWLSLQTIAAMDADHNIISELMATIDSHDNIFYSPDHLIAAVGIHDLVVVSIGQITLVCPKDRAQDVKKILAMMAANPKLEEHL